MPHTILNKMLKVFILFLSLFLSTQVLYGSTLLQKANTYYEEGLYSKAHKLFKKSAKKGNADAQYSLAVMYEGGIGVDKNITQALTWYKKSAKKGNINAQYNVASLYYKGVGIKKDYEKAAYWYEKAALAGDVSAMHNIGSMFLLGEGVKMNKILAFNYLLKAAKKSHYKAQKTLDILCKESPWACR